MWEALATAPRPLGVISPVPSLAAQRSLLSRTTFFDDTLSFPFPRYMYHVASLLGQRIYRRRR